MAKKIKQSYSPYGAFELKAKYQRNLLVGTFATTAFVVLLVGGIWLATAHSAEGDKSDGDEIDVVIILRPPPTIINERRLVVVDRARSEKILPHVPPVMVDDDEFLEENDVSLFSRTEFEGIDVLESNGGDGNGEFFDTENEGYFPIDEEFEYVEIMPEMIHAVVPEYPRLAKQAGLEGKVYIKALISEDGEVLKAEVVKSSGNRALDDAALRVAKQNKFKPGIQNGRPVKVWVTYKVDFVLTN